MRTCEGMRGWAEGSKLEQMDWEKVGGGTCHNDKPGRKGRIGRLGCGRICEVL